MESKLLNEYDNLYEDRDDNSVLLKKKLFYDFFSARPTTAGKLQKFKYLISKS